MWIGISMWIGMCVVVRVCESGGWEVGREVRGGEEEVVGGRVVRKGGGEEGMQGGMHAVGQGFRRRGAFGVRVVVEERGGRGGERGMEGWEGLRRVLYGTRGGREWGGGQVLRGREVNGEVWEGRRWFGRRGMGAPFRGW